MQFAPSSAFRYNEEIVLVVLAIVTGDTCELVGFSSRGIRKSGKLFCLEDGGGGDLTLIEMSNSSLRKTALGYSGKRNYIAE